MITNYQKEIRVIANTERGEAIWPYAMIRCESTRGEIPTTQLAKMTVDLKFVKLTADVLENQL